jgi:hypothetical protein
VSFEFIVKIANSKVRKELLAGKDLWRVCSSLDLQLVVDLEYARLGFDGCQRNGNDEEPVGFWW